MKKSVSSIDLNVSEAKEFEAIYKNLRQGVTRAASAWMKLRKSVLRVELHKVFEEHELLYIAELNKESGFDVDFMRHKSILVDRLHESYFHLAATHVKTDVEGLIQKVEKLTSVQVFFLQDWIDVFWYLHGKNGIAFEEYAKELL